VFSLFPVLQARSGAKAGTLSGGQQQMLALGRALVTAPRLLMLDEPSLGLAPIVADDLFASLRSLQERGVTILLVEQNARRALDLASRAYLLDLGRVAYQAGSADILRDERLFATYLGGRPGPAER
jgi:branched-chain amino acid transport system ATP-binding protein